MTIAPNDWPAYSVERRPLSGLIPYSQNARTHSPEQVEQIAASIREWGWTNPILVDEGDGIIAGHGRVLAAKDLGLVEVPVVVARGWTDAQKRAYILADNQLALNAGWDIGILKGELKGLQEWGFDLGLLGFDDLNALLLDTPGLTDPDEAPESPTRPVSRPGDVWLMGDHRLLCGDATKADDAACALNGVKPHLMVTDPPYGVNYDANWRNQAGRTINGGFQRLKSGKAKEPIGARAIGKVKNDDRADWRQAWALFPGTAAYVWHAGKHAAEVEESLRAVGFEIRSQIIWAKHRFVIGRGDYHWQHEPCWYAVKGKAQWQGDRSQTTLWQISHQASETGHSAQKPVECMKRPIENNSSPGQAIYDPFVGAGTTIIAAEMTGRACHAIELDPGYCDVSVMRWQNFTGKVAALEATGKGFAAIKKKRLS